MKTPKPREGQKEKARKENRMRGVPSVRGIYRGKRAFIAEQKTKRTLRESKGINALTGPRLIKGSE